MKIKRTKCGAIILILCLIISGCVYGPKPERLVNSLPKLTTAIEGYVRYPLEGEKSLNNEELINKLYEDKPELKRVFHGIPVNIWHNNRYVIVLIPSPKNDRAWLEDASWTTFVDRLWYQNKTPKPPEFTLIPAVPGN
jgi:hypothetical protein